MRRSGSGRFRPYNNRGSGSKRGSNNYHSRNPGNSRNYNKQKQDFNISENGTKSKNQRTTNFPPYPFQNWADCIFPASGNGAQKFLDHDLDAAVCCSQVRLDLFGGELSDDVRQLSDQSGKPIDNNCQSIKNPASNNLETKTGDNYRLIDCKSPYEGIGTFFGEFLRNSVDSGWSLYFPIETFVENNPRHMLIKLCHRFIADQTMSNADQITRDRFFTINYQNFVNFLSDYDDQSIVFSIDSDEIVKCAGLAMHKIISDGFLDTIDKSGFPKIHARFQGYDKIETIDNLQAMQILSVFPIFSGL